MTKLTVACGLLLALVAHVALGACGAEETSVPSSGGSGASTGTGAGGGPGGGTPVGTTSGTPTGTDTTTTTTSTSAPECLNDVTDFGATGDGATDDTSALNDAIAAAHAQGGGVVCVPAGTYLIDVINPVELLDDVTLFLADGATLQAIPTDSSYSAVLDISDVTNVAVIGGAIVGEREGHLGAGGEWGHGIRVLGAHQVRIADIAVSDCWGDGIYVGSSTQSCPDGVLIEEFLLDNNRRQGISVICATDLTVRNGTASNTHGTRPESGMDLEPNEVTEVLRDVLIEDFHTEYNAAYGIESWFGAGTGTYDEVPLENVSIVIRRHTDTGSVGGTLHNIQDYIEAGYDITVEQ